jgi:hypothetical protein
MSFLLDDQLSVQSSRARALVQVNELVTILVELGFILSVSKCQIIPTQRPVSWA